MTMSPRLEAMILEQLGEFGEIKADMRTVKADLADLNEKVDMLVSREQQSRGARNAIIAGIGAIGGLLSSGIFDLIDRLLQSTGKK